MKREKIRKHQGTNAFDPNILIMFTKRKMTDYGKNNKNKNELLVKK